MAATRHCRRKLSATHVGPGNGVSVGRHRARHGQVARHRGDGAIDRRARAERSDRGEPAKRRRECRDVLRQGLGPDYRVVDAMVPFNVVQRRKDGEATTHPSGNQRNHTNRERRGRPARPARRSRPARSPSMTISMRPYGASSSSISTTRSMLCRTCRCSSSLRDRRWRLLISRQMREGLAVLRAAGIRPAPVEGPAAAADRFRAASSPMPCSGLPPGA